MRVGGTCRHLFFMNSQALQRGPMAVSGSARNDNPEPLLIVELALLGIATGFLAGLLGIGGGMLMVPFITIILSAKGFPADYAVKMAVATSLATICFTSLSSVRAHHRRGAVLWPVVRRSRRASCWDRSRARNWRVALSGSRLERAVRDLRGLLGHADVPGPQTQGPRGPCRARWGTFASGRPDRRAVVAGGRGRRLHLGAVHDLVQHQDPRRCRHIGGAGISHRAGRDAGIHLGRPGLPQMPPGSVGYLYLPGLLVISLASVSTAPWGARTAHRMDIRPLRKVFAVMLYALAAYFLLR